MGPKKYIVVKDELGNTIISATNDLKGVMYLYFAYKMSQQCYLENRIYNAVLFKYIFLKFDLLDKYEGNKDVIEFYKSVEKMYHYHGLNNTNYYQASEKLISSCTFQYKNDLKNDNDGPKKNPYKNKDEFIEPKTLTIYVKEPEKVTEIKPYYTCDISENCLLDVYWMLEKKDNDVRTNIILGNFALKLISLLEMNEEIIEAKALADHMKRVILRNKDIDKGKKPGYTEYESQIKSHIIYKISIKKSIKNDPKLFAEYLFTSKETTFEDEFIKKLKDLFKEMIKDEDHKFNFYLTRLEIILYEHEFFNILGALKELRESCTETILRSVFIDVFKKQSSNDKGFEGNQRKHHD